MIQSRVFRLRRLQHRNVRIGILPQREEILIGRPRLRCVAGDHVGACQLQLCKWNTFAQRRDKLVIQNVLKFRRRLRAILHSQEGEAANIDHPKSGIERPRPELVSAGRFQNFDRTRAIPPLDAVEALPHWEPGTLSHLIQGLLLVKLP